MKKRITSIVLSSLLSVSLALTPFEDLSVLASETEIGITENSIEKDNSVEDETSDTDNKEADQIEVSNTSNSDNGNTGNTVDSVTVETEEIGDVPNEQEISTDGTGIPEDSILDENASNNTTNEELAAEEIGDVNSDEEIEPENEQKEALTENEAVVASGTCGSDIEWMITQESDSYTLIIEGNGTMTNYSSTDVVPWKTYIYSIKELIIDGDINYLGSNMLAGAFSLENASIPSSVTTIGYRAFYNCQKLSNIVIPDSVVTIGNEAFAGCNQLASVVFSSNLEEVGEGAFRYSGIVDANFGMKSITFGKFAFDSCSSLETVSFAGDSAILFNDNCFSNCRKLREIKITKNTTVLPEKCFYQCKNLKSIRIPLITRIYKSFGYSGLTDVYYDGTRQQWADKDIVYDNSDDPLRSAKIHYGTGGEEISGLSFDPATVAIDEGELIDISENIEPWTAKEIGLAYESSDDTIASVDKYGVVKGKRGGKVTVSAHLVDTDYSASCEIEVRGKVKEIKFDKNEIHIAKGRYDSIVATVLPEDAYDKTLTWKSSDTSVVTVDSRGVVKAIGLGSATITATDRYNNASQSCEVKVYRPIESIKLSQSLLTMKKGQTASLIATNTPSTNTYDCYDWKSSDETVAKVDSAGNIEALDAGSSVITCMAMDGTEEYATCEVIVTVPVDSVTFNEDTLDLQVGTTTKISFTVSPENASDKSVIWECSDESIAKVDQQGNVEALKGGSSVITCTSVDNPNAKAECTVNVVVPITGISLDENNVNIEKGHSKKLIPIPEPSDTTEDDYIWESSDEQIATVDERGYITAESPGTAIVTCIAKNHPDIKAECQVEVFVPVTNIEIEKESISLLLGEEETLSISILPDDATSKSVIWSSDNESIATVDNKGEVHAIGGGTAVITCTSEEYPTIKSTCMVHVRVPVTRIDLNNSNLEIYKGDGFQLTASLYPSDTTDTELIWTSSNNSVAAVDEKGRITALGKGNAVIKCSSKNNISVYSECVVSVGIKVDSMSISRENATLFRGNSMKLTVEIGPEDASDKSVTWRSSDENVASVDENGLVVSNAVGVAIITCISTNNTSIRTSCEVSVIDLINDAEILNVQDKTYTGKEITQTPTVVLRNGIGLILLEEGVDYTVSYENNINAGTATIKISGIGNYIGTVTKDFIIKKIANTITAKNIIRTYSTKAQTFDLGVKIKSGTPTYKSNNKSVTVSKAGKATIKAKFIGKATITIIAPEKTNHTTTTKKITITVNPTKSVLSKVSNSASKKMTVVWRKNAVGSGYQIQYSTSSKFTSARTVSVTKNTIVSKTIGNLVKGKKYYVRIRTYKTIGNVKYYSGWGAVKTVTIKK